jgi:hypothetical protein
VHVTLSGLICLLVAFYNNQISLWLFLSPKDWNDYRRIKLRQQNREAVTFLLNPISGYEELYRPRRAGLFLVICILVLF